MKTLKLLCASLLLSALAYSQSNSIDSIPSTSTAIELPPAEHWRVIMPGELFNRATFHLVRAEGCWVELAESKTEKEALKNQIESLGAQVMFLNYADQKTAQIDQNTDEIEKRNKWQAFWAKVGNWFKARTREIIAFVVGVASGGGAVYVIYITAGF